MQTYIGNGPYCYANTASMLLESICESVEPRLLEVLSGVGLGSFWLKDPGLLFLSGWASPPDIGISRSFRLLGFEVKEEAEKDGSAMPMEELKSNLERGPVMIGPLDMGELAYQPYAVFRSGSDHYILVLDIEGDEFLVHDPAGYPCVPIKIDALERAWRADRIEYRRGSYRKWHSPVRTGTPSREQIAEDAITSFSRAYRESHSVKNLGIAIGPEAINEAVSIIMRRELSDQSLGHLQLFALALGVRRALDYEWYFRGFNIELARLKHMQALHLGRAHAAAVKRDWVHLANNLSSLSDLEYEFEISLMREAS